MFRRFPHEKISFEFVTVHRDFLRIDSLFIYFPIVRPSFMRFQYPALLVIVTAASVLEPRSESPLTVSSSGSGDEEEVHHTGANPEGTEQMPRSKGATSHLNGESYYSMNVENLSEPKRSLVNASRSAPTSSGRTVVSSTTSHAMFTFTISPDGFIGEFTIGGSRVSLLVDTACNKYVIDGIHARSIRFRPHSRASLVTFAGRYVRHIVGDTVGRLGGVTSNAVLNLGDRSPSGVGVLGIGPTSDLGSAPFALVPMRGNMVEFTRQVHRLRKLCTEGEFVTLPLDQRAMEEEELFVVPLGSIKVGKSKVTTEMVIASGMPGIELPGTLYDEFVNKLRSRNVPLASATMEYEGYLMTDMRICQDKEHYAPLFPMIKVVLGGSDWIYHRVDLTQYAFTSRMSACIIPVVRSRSNNIRVSIGSLVLGKFVTVFYRQTLDMCVANI
jgi:hypothetical protein